MFYLCWNRLEFQAWRSGDTDILMNDSGVSVCVSLGKKMGSTRTCSIRAVHVAALLLVLACCCEAFNAGLPLLEKIAVDSQKRLSARLRRESPVKHKTQHLNPAIEIEPLPNQRVKAAMPHVNARELLAFAAQAKTAIDARFDQVELAIFSSNGEKWRGVSVTREKSAHVKPAFRPLQVRNWNLRRPPGTWPLHTRPRLWPRTFLASLYWPKRQQSTSSKGTWSCTVCLVVALCRPNAAFSFRLPLAI